MIGDWQDHWEQLQALQARLKDIAAGRAGGSVVARADLMSFFERSESLRDWVKRALGSPGSGVVDPAMKASLPLSLAHDIAIKIKHQVQGESPWTGARDADVVSQSVTVRPQTISLGQSLGRQPEATSAHRWGVQYTPPGASSPIELDGLQLSQDIVVAWRQLLQAARLI
jgi:hypothetical protein